ncbi:MAG: putative ABC transporter permease [Candidatus Doudnabacteria bacterium]
MMAIQIIVNYFIGFLAGYILELGYRSVEAKKLVKPLLVNAQMYGLSAIGVYLSDVWQVHFIIKVFLILILTTGIEFVFGFYYLKVKRIRLWDYSKERLNYKGIVSFNFSLYWLIIALLYYYFVLPSIILYSYEFIR